MLEDVHSVTKKDAAIATAVMKTADIARALELIFIKFSICSFAGGTKVYARTSADFVYEITISITRPDGSHAFTYQSYQLPGEQNFKISHASSEREFVEMIERVCRGPAPSKAQ